MFDAVLDPRWRTLIVVVLMVAALALEVTSPELVVFAALTVLLVTGTIPPEDAVSGFGNPALLTIAALFVVAAGVRRTGALAFLERRLVPASGGVRAALARILLPSAAVSAFINNTPLVASLIPVVQQGARRARIPPSKLLLPLSHATVLGGTCTLIGTSTNLVVSGLLAENGRSGFGLFELAWVGVPATLVGVLYYFTLGERLLPVRPDTMPVDRRSLRRYQFELAVPEGSPLAGRSIGEAGLRALRGAFLAHIRRGGELIGPASPESVLRPGDVLTFTGDPALLEHLLDGTKLARVVDPPGDDDGGELPLFEAVVAAESSLAGRSLKEAGFRERFQAVVLGIHRAGRRVEGPLGTTPLEPGDLLLIEAGPDFEARWSGSGEFYLVAPLERGESRAGAKAPWMLGLLGLLVAAMGTGLLGPLEASFGAAILAVVLGILPPLEARRAVDLSVLVLIGSALGVGEAVEKSGLAGEAGAALVNALRGLGPAGVLGGVYLATNLLTEFLTNSVAAVLIFPIGLHAAGEMGVDPRAFAVAVAVAASCGFATPIGYQTNLMVMGPGGYRFRDYVKVGLPLNLLVFVLAVSLIAALWL